MSGLFKATVIKGNKLTEFAQTTATVGVPIPFGHGRFPTDGNVIFAALPPKETRTVKRQGKGGVKQESFTYSMSYAVSFCLGPIYGFWWIKRNGKVVYSSDPAAPVEDAAYAAKWLQKATLYYGTATQLPDSTIEAVKGSGQVSGFHYLAYIVLEGDDVTEGGGAVPSYEAVPIATPPEAYLTSRPYPIIQEPEGVISSFTVFGGVLRQIPPPYEIESEGTDSSLSIIGGELRQPLHTYEMESEGADSSISVIGGELRIVLLNYTIPNEGTDSAIAVTGGTLKVALFSYTIPNEGVDSAISITGGTLI